MNALSYILTISTGETISFLELDSELIPELISVNIVSGLSDVLRLCTHVSRETIEKAKRNDTKPLERALRTPPYGCLLKLKSPVCAEIKTCFTAKVGECTTRNISRKSGPKLGLFPFCWNYSATNVDINIIGTDIVNAWKSGSYVLLIV